MPTKQQLFDIWDMEFNHPWTRRADDPMYQRPEESKFEPTIMTLKERVNSEFVSAFKAKNMSRKDTLGMLKSKITEIEKKAGTDATDADVLSAIQTLVKQRQQTVEAYRGNDNEAARAATEKELSEIAILQEFLPKQLTKEEIKEEVLECMKDMLFPPAQKNAAIGKIMNYFKSNRNGQYDAKELKGIVDEIMNG